MRFLLELAWRDLRGSGRSLWVFCACLLLGVTLIAASGGLYRLVNAGLLADTRLLLGGDVEVDADDPLPAEALEWMADNGRVTLVTELYTMLGTPAGDFFRVELQSMDEHYPLYGDLVLQPAGNLQQLTRFDGEQWGVAIDRSLAQRYDLRVGDNVYIGALAMAVRAVIMEQPDRNLTAEWRGPPVLVAAAAVHAAGLIQPGSRVDYDYKVATEIPADTWRKRFYQRFPNQTWEVRTFGDRSERIAERLGQLASGLLIVAFSTLFIGGLGVFGSIQSYLQNKLRTIATLRSLGLRNRRLAIVYLLQVGMLGAGASLAGCLLGAGLAGLGSTLVSQQVNIETTTAVLVLPLLAALGFGLLTAFCFALPAIGRALSVSPASLFRDVARDAGKVPRNWCLATALLALAILLLVLMTLPDTLFGIGFIAVVAILLVLLEAVLRGIRWLAHRLDNGKLPAGDFALRLALANLHRPGSALRSTMLSLGSALTLLVACTLVVVSLIRTIYATIPEEAPTLVLYDINAGQVTDVVAATESVALDARVQTAPLVRSRIKAINGRPASELAALGDHSLRKAINDDHKLSYPDGNIDGVELVAGSWWTSEASPVMSLEDREARRLRIGIGDRIRYRMENHTIEVDVVAIHRQKGIQSRFRFEGIVSAGLLDTSIYRHVGTAWFDDTAAIEAQRRIAAVAPNVISVRTERLLSTARALLGQATSGLALVAGVSLLASLLVLVSVISAGRTRQIYDATVLTSLGARLSVVHRSLYAEFALVSLVTALFALILGAAIALPLLEWRMKLPSQDLIWVGTLTAFGVSGLSLALGARYLKQRLRLRPAILLRDVG